MSQWSFGLPDMNKTMCVAKCPTTGLDMGEGVTAGLLNWLKNPVTVRSYYTEDGEKATSRSELVWYDTGIPQ